MMVSHIVSNRPVMNPVIKPSPSVLHASAILIFTCNPVSLTSLSVLLSGLRVNERMTLCNALG